MSRMRPTILVLFAVLLVGAWDCWFANSSPTGRTIAFRATPKKQVFKQREDVVLLLSIRNNSPEPIFVSRLTDNEFVDIELRGPGGKEVPWQGTGKIDSKNYSASDFTVLKPNEKVSAYRTISVKNGRGFLFQKRGRYSLTAEYLLTPPEYFSPLAGNAKVPSGSFKSLPATFCIETCDADPPK